MISPPLHTHDDICYVMGHHTSSYTHESICVTREGERDIMGGVPMSARKLSVDINQPTRRRAPRRSSPLLVLDKVE